MKVFLFLTVVTFIAFSCKEAKKEYAKNADVLANNLKGKVKQTVDTTYKADSAGTMGEQDSCCVVKENYDENGYGVSYTSENKAKTDNEETVIERYEKGELKTITNTKNGKPLSKISIQIDKDGNYSGAQSFDSSNKMDSYYTDLTTNEYGQLTNFKQFKPDSTLKMSGVSNYDKQIFKGGITKDSSGKEIYSTDIKFDDKNNVIESSTKEVTKDSTINKTKKYTYASFDDNGNWTQRTEMDENGKRVKIEKRTITYYKD